MHFRVGEIRVDIITELNKPFIDAHWLFPNFTPERLKENAGNFPAEYIDTATAMLWMPVQAFLLRSGDKTVLVDTGVGNHREYPIFPDLSMKDDSVFFDNLAKVGVGPRDIDLVVHTHLHADHFGWDTMLVDGKWVPTFPNAKVKISKSEYEYWHGRWREQRRLTFGDTIEVVIAEGHVDMVEDDAEIIPGVRLFQVPGHTPHNATIHLSSQGEEAYVAGDWIHSPLQCELTDIIDESDVDGEQGQRTRNEMMAKCADAQTLVAPTHFPIPSLGRFERDGDAFKWIPVAPEQ